MIEQFDKLGDIEPQEWNELPGARASPLLTHEWLASAARVFHAESDVEVVTVRRGQQLCAAAPLTMGRGHGLRRFELPGALRLFEPSGLLYSDAEALHELCGALVSLRHPLALHRIADFAEVASALVIAAQGRGSVRRAAASPSPVLPIDVPWERYYASLSSRRRQDYRRNRKRLEGRGATSIEILSPKPELLVELMREAFQVESSGWKGRRGSGLMTNQSLHDFFASYAQLACGLGILRLCFLRIDGHAIAMQIAVEHANRWWVLKVGFDEQWADFSPGIQLTMDTVRHAFENGLEAYEFLGTCEPWLQVWTRQERSYATVNWYPRTVTGASARALDSMATAARRLVRAVQAGSREVLTRRR